jgi:hypothetical protein
MEKTPWHRLMLPLSLLALNKFRQKLRQNNLHDTSQLIKFLAWQGKVFHTDQAFLLNKITPFGFKLVKAQVYRGESWIDGKEATILDYSKTSFVAQKIRDEIREVAPGLYLGQAYWGKWRVLNFILEF